MSEMVERVADAMIARATRGRGMLGRPQALDLARAAIEAMREPLSLVRDVHGTFARDIEQGFVTKDKTYAVDLLGKAVAEFDAAISEEKTPA